MSLLTKYRPSKFDDVIGQDLAVNAIKLALKNKTNRAFLFTGAPGLGKTTLARITASTAKCEEGDIIEIDAATNSGVDDMRAVAELFDYPPYGDSARAVIVDESHVVSKQAWSSLLKSIEETPEWGYWMLCTSEAAKVPVAIKSRCLHIDLKSVKDTVLIPWLTDIAADQKNKWSNDHRNKTVKLCVEKADGSPRQALANLSLVLSTRSVDEAQELLNTHDESSGAIDLARALSKGAKWNELQRILRGIQDQNPESVRQVVLAYYGKIAINAGGPILNNALAILEEFEKPFNPMDKMIPLIMACARLTK